MKVTCKNCSGKGKYLLISLLEDTRTITKCKYCEGAGKIEKQGAK